MPERRAGHTVPSLTGGGLQTAKELLMNLRKLREDLGRAKASANRNELERALSLTLLALKELGGQSAPMDLRGDFREAINSVTALAAFKSFHAAPIIYQGGKERDIFAVFAHVYKTLQASKIKPETYEEAMERKMALDKTLKEARSELERGKVSEADALYAKALTYYRDEKAVFGLIARQLMEVDEVVRALGYLKKGLAALPGNQELQELVKTCTARRAELGR